jgi:hypothetical protein
VNTFTGAVNGAIQGWNARDYVPSEDFGWDTYRARSARYLINNRYYNNQAYNTINAYVAAMIYQKKLYKHIRGVRNPIASSIDFFVSKIYPGSLDMETAQTGAVPLQADKRIRDAIIALWDASNFATLRNIYVREGATSGDTFIKLVNDAQDGCIYQEIVPPAHVTSYKRDQQGNITYAVIEYLQYENTILNTMPFAYQEVIEADGYQTHTATYKNGKPHAYYSDENGKPLQEWDTDYGFVPLLLAQHTNLGLNSGACAFQTAIPKVDEINAQATLLDDQINKAVNVVWLMSGVGKGNGERGTDEPELTLNNDSKTNVNIIKAGKDARATALIADINIADALKNIESLESSLEREMPELALYKLWDAQQISGVAVNKLYDPVVSRVKLARSNYDDTLVRCHQMAISMGAYHGYPEYAGFGVDDYMLGNLTHSIKDRTVFDDTVERPQKLQALITVKDQPSEIAALILNELDYSEATIKKVVAQLDEQQAQADEAAARAFMQSALGSGDNGDEQETTSGGVQPRTVGNSSARPVEATSVP